MAGLIQTVFLISFMLGSPLCGYLGDRFDRKQIIVVGMTLWLTAIISSTLVPAEYFWMFLLFRGIVGIGEASYANICPSIISDLFVGKTRSRMFMIYCFAVPVGSGFGFVIGTNVASLMGAWQWGVRVTAIGGIVALILLVILVDEPKRGAAEEEVVGADVNHETPSSYWQDIKALVSIPTFVTCTWAYTSLVFVTGTLSWWEPTIIQYSFAWNRGLNSTQQLPKSEKNQIGLIFGTIVTVSGLIGVSVGAFLSETLRQGYGIFRPFKTERAQPIVAGIGTLIAALLLFFVFLIGHKSITVVWILLFFLSMCISFNWSLNVDLLMSVIVPWRRNTASSYFILISHLFGDASGPYIIGTISDASRKSIDTPRTQYISLVKSCSVTVVLLCISGLLYMICAVVLIKDQLKFRKQMG
ncbi:transporter, major facilitator family protein [Dictyocaulus viviparus]|uniref:Transporter, major facilitator family protein n=1 Tax=Dictyocaulus viviparus TaxID=29172 RepID=A0A0D8Y2Y9_DICVI|nr:transporter, major facilitator family protein [Dictyocaulus viviparus]